MFWIEIKNNLVIFLLFSFKSEEFFFKNFMCFFANFAENIFQFFSFFQTKTDFVLNFYLSHNLIIFVKTYLKKFRQFSN